MNFILKYIFLLTLLISRHTLGDQVKDSICLSHDKLSLQKSQNQVMKYFLPNLGETAKLDGVEITNFYKDKRFFIPEIKGYIEASPPKGTCFTITKRELEEDLSVCYPEKKMISFDMRDIDDEGSINWTLSTCQDDSGTKISWPTPYRTGIMKKVRSGPEVNELVGIESCIIQNNSSHKGRKLQLTLINGKKWNIRFPEKDKLVSPQPPTMKNLFVGKIPTNSGFVALAVDPNTTSTLESQQAVSGDGIKAWRTRYKNSTPWDWRIHPRNSFTMSASNFIGESSVPRGSKGECRYRYPDKKLKKTSVIECFNAPLYKWLYLPLTCLHKNKVALSE